MGLLHRSPPNVIVPMRYVRFASRLCIGIVLEAKSRCLQAYRQAVIGIEMM